MLAKLAPSKCYAEINPQDAANYRIRTGDRVEISSQRGQLTANAFVTPTVAAGQVFVPMHYPQTNLLTDAVLDPYSAQSAYKACAVKLRRVTESG